ncbi:MAG: hypothetical protein CSB24_04125 [Deltaproteobacteria bacterium]|nr:MAG: hypothetical protein CSB24_04125 [Deltaproteobacteria bacterium]
MPVTPQAIKDQEFQTKLRGYDSVEVRAYLELLAEEFFELLEEKRGQKQENEVLLGENEDLADEKRKYIHELEQLKKKCSQLEDKAAAHQTIIKEIEKEKEDLRTLAADLEQEKKDLAEEISTQEAKLQEAGEKIAEEIRQKEQIINKLEVLKEQNEELRKEEFDFKSTLGAAQKFAREIKRKSEEHARLMMNKAKADVGKFRETSSLELSRIPEEIKELHQKREQVRNELKTLLNTYLEAVDTFSVEEDRLRIKEIEDLHRQIATGKSADKEADKGDDKIDGQKQAA